MSAITKKKTNLPILENCLVKVSSKEPNIIVRATNLEVEITSTCAIVLIDEENYSFLLNPIEINKLIKKFPEQPLSIYVEDDTIIIQAENAKYDFSIDTDIDSYPEHLDGDKKSINEFDIAADAFIEMIAKLSHTVANDNLRPAMNGINMRYDKVKDNVFAASTDAHFLSKLDMGLSVDAKKGLELIIPDISDIFKLIAVDEMLTMNVYKNSFSIESIDKLVVRCIEGTYPNYESVIPDILTMDCITLEVLPLLRAIERLSLVGTVKASLEFKIADMKLEIMCTDTDYNNTGTETISIIETTLKEDFTIGVDPIKFSVLLKIFSFSEVNMFVDTSTTAIIFKPANVNVDVETYLLMPKL